MRSVFILSLIASSALLSGSIALAQKLESRAQIKRGPEFHLTGEITREQSAVKVEGEPYVSDWLFTLGSSLKVNDDLAFSASLTGSQDLVTEKFSGDQFALGVKKPSGFLLGRAAKLTPRFSVALPLSDDAKADSLKAMSSAGGRFDLNPKLLHKRLRLGGDLSGTAYFQEYTTSIDGRVNKKWRSIQSVDASWTFTRALSLSLSLSHYDVFSHQDAHRDYISHSQELGYEATSNVRIALGHSWGAPYVSTRKANGQDLNLAVADEQNSIVYGTMTVTL